MSTVITVPTIMWHALAMCFLHMDKRELINIQRTILTFGSNMKDAEKKRELLNKAFKEELHLYFEIEHLLVLIRQIAGLMLAALCTMQL